MFKSVSVFENCKTGVVEDSPLIMHINVETEPEELKKLFLKCRLLEHYPGCVIVAERKKEGILEMEVERFLELY